MDVARKGTVNGNRVTRDRASLPSPPYHGSLRHDLDDLRKVALKAVDPAAAVARHLQREGDVLRVAGHGTLGTFDRVILCAVGKAAVPMAEAAAGILGEGLISEQRLSGVVVTKVAHATGHALPAALRVIEAGHPIPDAAGQRAGEAVLDVLESTTAQDLVLVLLSGGASALLPAPAPGLTLGDLQDTTDLLLRAGATIVELNAVRKHLSRLKGGQMARLAAPARVVVLILSDVVGDPLDVIASGPTAPDPTTFEDALGILRRYELLSRVPSAVADLLQAGAGGRQPETPKPGDAVFDAVTHVLVGSNRLAAEAVVARARELGYNSLLLTTFVEGEAREVAKVAVALVKGVRAHGHPLRPPACLIWGGETTVTIRGNGKGGRNQELALSAALGLDGLPGVALLALATDGTDGPTDAAGAVVDGDTVRRALAQGLDPYATLAANDSYGLLERTGDLLRLGPTGTNVNDLLIALVVGD
ncbi:MAG: glycerate kinase [Anaerolineae bacterium]|nr:glycerate kinase [Anaerolineae bacterium]